MSTDRWQLLSEWHNAWLTAGPAERDADGEEPADE